MQRKINQKKRCEQQQPHHFIPPYERLFIRGLFGQVIAPGMHGCGENNQKDGNGAHGAECPFESERHGFTKKGATANAFAMLIFVDRNVNRPPTLNTKLY